MQDLKPSYTVSSHLERSEVHFSISGFWDLEPMQEFLGKLNKAGWPLAKQGRPIFVLGDMEGFVPQTRDTGEAIRDQLMLSKDVGLVRVAILGGSTLVRQQYRRLSEGVDVMFFDDKAEAFAWLRSPLDA